MFWVHLAVFNGSGRFRFTITEIMGKQSTQSHVHRERMHFHLCPSPSSTWLCCPNVLQQSPSHAHLALTVGERQEEGGFAMLGGAEGNGCCCSLHTALWGCPAFLQGGRRDSGGCLQLCQQHPCLFCVIATSPLPWTVCTPGAVLALPGMEGLGGKGETFMETGDLCPFGGGNWGCHGDSFSK